MSFFKKLKRMFLWGLMALPVPGYFRARLAFAAGVQLKLRPEDTVVDVFIGQNAQIDSIHPEFLTIGNWTTIATGVVILTHFLDPDGEEYPYFCHSDGRVEIGRGCFIGANSVICKPVSIGDGSIVAAGSVVLHDIPPMEIWGGNPAHFIRKRKCKEPLLQDKGVAQN